MVSLFVNRTDRKELDKNGLYRFPSGILVRHSELIPNIY